MDPKQTNTKRRYSDVAAGRSAADENDVPTSSIEPVAKKIKTDSSNQAELEVFPLKERYSWLRDQTKDLIEVLSPDKLKSWLFEGKRETVITKTDFCDPKLLRQLLAPKKMLSTFDEKTINNAQQRSDPFGEIRKEIFGTSRAAMKMANMDATLEFMFTKPVDENGESLVQSDEVLHFADVCAGPGGFSEYVLWREKTARGIGFTLKATSDFKLDAFINGRPEMFDTFYGIKGDGDIFDPENIKSLTDHVLEKVSRGVHFMMSDGGYDVSGKPRKTLENLSGSKRMGLCQCLVALSIVRINGHFVTKLFDLFTPFNVGLVYFMYKCFKQITILKPHSSRPNSSERYLVCKWKKENTDTIRDHLIETNRKMFNDVDSDKDVLGFLPLEVIKKDRSFFDYIQKSNEDIAQREISAVQKISEYCKDVDRTVEGQGDLRMKCLKLWKIPLVPALRRSARINAFSALRGSARINAAILTPRGNSNNKWKN